MRAGNVWALVLAAGEGTRLSSLTTTASGHSVPKQFCSLRGGPSLLREAIGRATSVVHPHQVVTVLADQHQRWWKRPLRSLPAENLVVQPHNRGTAAGLLLPLLHIAHRDPEATVVVLPSDHFVADEASMAASLRRMTRLARADADHVYLLGLAPEEADPELGYIVPSAPGAAAAVKRFVEKPTVEVARALIGEGALLNLFILAASVRALIGLYETTHADLLARMRAAVWQDRACPQDGPETRQLYQQLPNVDFSRQVLEGQEARLRVLAAPACGWSDLGTPRRVAETLARHGSRTGRANGDDGESYVNLADRNHIQPMAISRHAYA